MDAVCQECGCEQPQHSFDCPQRDCLDEAYRIAGGKSAMLPQVEHLDALIADMRSLLGKGEVLRRNAMSRTTAETKDAGGDPLVALAAESTATLVTLIKLMAIVVRAHPDLRGELEPVLSDYLAWTKDAGVERLFPPRRV